MSENWPKVSIIIPVYNREIFIGPALDSIFKQNYPKNKIEVLVVDAGSTDKTLEIAKKYPVRIVHIDDPMAKKIGEPGKVLGYKKMTGEYYFYLDSDAEFVSKNFIRDLIYPFIDNPEIAGSFTRYMPSTKQNAFNRYVSYNELQLWGLLSFLLPKISEVTIDKKAKYDIVRIDPDKSPPIGMCFFRKKFLKEVIKNPDKFNYVDIAIPLQLAELGHDKFAYVGSAGMYHRRDGLKREIFRARRDVTVTYLPVVGERKFNYIDFKNPFELLKLVGWVIYVNLLMPSLIIGILKCIKYKDFAGMYELPTNLILTDYIIYLFLTEKTGRSLIKKVLLK
jgi:glycosyltransferase involved in cell wall biosynthesis